MYVLIGLLLIAGGVAFAIIQYRNTAAQLLETQYMQTSSIQDAMATLDAMSTTDPFYRHYVELKGNLVCEEPLISPFANRQAAYYSNRCASVSEHTDVYQDDDGNRRTRVSKQETELSSEKQGTEAYLKDGSCDVRVYVNFESFGKDVDLVECCDRFEPADSSWSNRFGGRYSTRMSVGGRFLGYHLKEKIFPANTPVYVLGEMLRMGDRCVVEKAQIAKKPSKLSYKSEEQLVQDHKTSQNTSLIIGGGMALVGVIMIIMNFV